MVTGGMALPFLILSLDGEWLASCPRCFTPAERGPGTHCIGGWVGPEQVWTLWEREKSLALLEIDPSHPAHSPLSYRLRYPSSQDKRKITYSHNF
jgi:hypothetical protein